MLTPEVWFHLGPIAVSETIVVSAGISVLLVAFGLLAVRLPRLRELAEVLYAMLARAVQDMVAIDATPLVPLILTMWAFIATANVIGVLPLISSPTRDLSLTAALAVVSLGAGHVYGFRAEGWRYLAHYVQPNPIMLPFNIIGELSRTVALALRLFGNMASGEIIAAVMISLVGLFLPIPLMLLDLLTSVVQAYIFGVLTLVFTASSMKVAAHKLTPALPGETS